MVVHVLPHTNQGTTPSIDLRNTYKIKDCTKYNSAKYILICDRIWEKGPLGSNNHFSFFLLQKEAQSELSDVQCTF